MDIDQSPGQLSFRLSAHPITLLTFLSFRICTHPQQLSQPVILPSKSHANNHRTASLLVYLLGLLFTSNFVLIFIITILLLAADFYYLKARAISSPNSPERRDTHIDLTQ